MKKNAVILKEGREKSLLNRHPWIFSGAVLQMPECRAGEIFPVYSSKGAFLATAYFNPAQSLMGRVLAFENLSLDEILENRIKSAISFRGLIIDKNLTSCFRLINAEGDGLPGLIVDVYGDILVIQISTYGIEVIKDKIIALLISYLKPLAIYEKSTSSSRSQEGLTLREGPVYGSIPEKLLVKENGITFEVDVVNGQKTGFFLDQREMRALVRKYAKGTRLLNAFSYSGGFSLYALAGGAKKVVSLDRDVKALELASKHVLHNGFDAALHQTIAEDVFDFLEKDPFPYNFVILDPPAFAKKQKDIATASKGYKEINKKAISKMPKGSFLLTSSCSYYVDKRLFQQVVFQAAAEAKRSVKILSHHIQASDHPIMLAHQEGEYLKSLFLYVE